MKRRSKLAAGLLITSMLTGITLSSCGNSYPFYEPIVNQYRVRWFSNDELTTLLYETTVWQGENATYPAELGTPTFEGTDPKYDYTFSNWSELTNNVQRNMDVFAVFTPTLKTYTMTYLREDESVYRTLEVDAGTKVGEIDHPSGPAKDSDNQYSYTFEGWETTVSEDSEVLSDLTFTPVYERTARVYNAYFMDGDGTTILETQEVPYGGYATIPEDVTPTSEITPNPNDFDTATTHAFLGWSPNPLSTQITQNTTFTPTFSENTTTVRTDQGKIVDALNGLPSSTVTQNVTIGSSAESAVAKSIGSRTLSGVTGSAVNLFLGHTEGGDIHDRIFQYYVTLSTTLESTVTTEGTVTGTFVVTSEFKRDGVVSNRTVVTFTNSATGGGTLTWDFTPSVAGSSYGRDNLSDEEMGTEIVVSEGSDLAGYRADFYDTVGTVFTSLIEEVSNSFFNSNNITSPY